MPRVVGFDENITKRVTCICCGAINEYSPNEVKTDTWKDWNDGNAGKEYISCGFCGKAVTLKSW